MKSTLRCTTIRLLLLMLVAFFLGACGRGPRAGGGTQDVETPVLSPTPLIEAMPTFTPTDVPLPTNTPEPTAIPPTHTPISTPTAELATVNIQANIRSGPGLNYPVVEVLDLGARIQPVAQSLDRQWLQMANGRWIYASLVDNIPAGLPVARNVPPPPIPPTATPVPATITPQPTNTPRPISTPSHGDWGDAIALEDVFEAPDGLSFKITDVFASGPAGQGEDEDRTHRYIPKPAGGKCRGCLVVIMEIQNRNGNQNEYVVQDDFQLLKAPGAQPQRQVTCDRDALPTGEGIGARLDAKPIGRGYTIEHPETRVLCFEDIPDAIRIIKRDYKLAYTHRFFYVPLDPTPTPSRPEEVGPPLESNQKTQRSGWTLYFRLG